MLQGTTDSARKSTPSGAVGRKRKGRTFGLSTNKKKIKTGAVTFAKAPVFVILFAQSSTLRI